MARATQQLHCKQNRFQQLRGFCHVVQTGSISKAAERMLLSQPSVSLQIQALEKELQVMLFERHGPNLHLTPEGQTLYELAQPLVDGMDNLYIAFTDCHNNVDTGTMTIAASSAVVRYKIKDAIRRFSLNFPNVKIKLLAMEHDELLDAVSKDTIDMAISLLPEKNEALLYQDLYRFRMMLIMPFDHPLSHETEIDLERIAEYPLLLAADQQMLMQAFKQRQLSVNIKAEMSDIALLKSFVEEGMGISIVSSVCLESTDKLVLKDLSSYFPARDYGIILRKGRCLSPQVKNFVVIIKDPYQAFIEQKGKEIYVASYFD